MALRLPLPALDKRGVALARARFHAWWEGREFDRVAAEAAMAVAANDAEAELFAPEPPPADPRIDALQCVWGEDRVAPGDPAWEAGLPAQLALPATAVLGVFGPGLAAPVRAVAETHLGPIRVFEWREEAVGWLQHGLSPLEARASVTAIDLETFTAPAEALDGAVSIDDFCFADNAPRLAVQLARALKPGAAAVVETYCASGSAALAAGFASAFREPQVRQTAQVASMLVEAGLALEGDDDITAPHVEAARATFRALGDRLRSAPPSPAVAREIAWEAESWRVRLGLLVNRQLERRRFRVRRGS